ncbi:MAG: glycosyltransferase [Sandaracinaceae bacterium]
MAERPPRVLCLQGICNYDHLRFLLAYMKRAFEAEGVDTRLWDLARGRPSVVQWRELEAFAPDLVFTFNLIGQELRRPDGGPLSLTSWMVDEPYYHPQWAALFGEARLQTYWPCPELAEEARAMGAASPRTLTLAGRVLPTCRAEDRDIDVLFVGSAADPDGMRRRWGSQLGPAVARLLDGVAEEWAVAPSERSLPALFRSLCASLGLDGHDTIRRLEPLLLGEVNRYVRSRKRIAILRALAALGGGRKVVVYGDGWPGLVPAGDLTFRGAIPFPLFEEEVLRSRVFVTAQPIHAMGPSERYFTAMANGTALVVNENTWLREHYGSGNAYAPYDVDEPRTARDRVEALLSNEPERRRMVEAARARTVAAHTWGHRARELLAGLDVPGRAA